MPEGDTIHRLASAMGRDLTGRRLEHLELQHLGTVSELRGARVEQVAAQGKHLLVHLEGDWSLRVHLGMKGRWRRLGPGRPPPGLPTVLIQAGGRQWACVRAYQAELVRTGRLRTHPRLARLGPDLLADEPDIDGAVRRARLPAHAHREIGDALLDQRIAAGIGNVYKSEVLFVRRVHPRTALRALSDDELRGLFAESARLMGANLKTIWRTSVPLQRRPEPGSPRLWVYDRGGKPCLECGGKIERIVQGDLARSTYFCPECQPDAGGGLDPGPA
jgi:endonuclease-8